MLDGLTVDQIRIFLAAVDKGSFSAAGRHIGRAQSVISQTLSIMETRLGVTLFDRTGRYPILTPIGRDLVPDARRVIGAIEGFKGRAKMLSGGLEPEVALTVDVMFPLQTITRVIHAFEKVFPETSLNLSVEALGGVVRAVADGRSAFGVAGPLAEEHPNLTRLPLPGVPMRAVASPSHPLASLAAPVSIDDLSQHRQLVLTDKSELTLGRTFGVLSASTWRLSDLTVKHAFLKEGLGWGAMPLHLVKDEIENGSLVVLNLSEADWMTMPMHAIYATAHPPGTAGQWFIKALSADEGFTERTGLHG